jgi:tetratricopeptide (TPR) repeat protein
MVRLMRSGDVSWDSPELTRRLKAYARGELTWAEVEGMTFEQAQAIAQVGCELAALGRLEEARVLFEGLVEGNPKDASAQAALATVYQKLGRVEEALAAYTSALAQAPGHPVALAHRGELRLRLGDADGLTDLALAVDADPAAKTGAGKRAAALVKAMAQAAANQGGQHR